MGRIVLVIISIILRTTLMISFVSCWPWMWVRQCTLCPNQTAAPRQLPRSTAQGQAAWLSICALIQLLFNVLRFADPFGSRITNY